MSKAVLAHIYVVFLFACSGLLSQSYTLSTTGIYSIEIGTPVNITLAEDDSEEIPIGFNFEYFGNTYTHCWVGSDGFVSFGTDPGGGCCGQMLPDADPVNNVMAVVWTNMDGHSIHYEVFGTAPDRRLVITFDYLNPCDSTYYGQLKLFETTNVIEIHTQQWTQDQCQSWSATQGIENESGTEAIVVPGRNFNNTWQVLPGEDDFVSFTPVPPVQAYMVSQTGTYNIEIDDPTFISLSGDDATEIPIGFDFDFFDTPYAFCWVGGDGFVSFGTDPGGGCCGQLVPDTNSINNVIAPCWTNMDFQAAHYEVFGTAPNRRLVITLDYRNPCDSVYYGQVKLFESTNIIEIHTQEWAQNECQVWSATQGIENADGTEAYPVPGRNFNNTWSVEIGANDYVSFTPVADPPPPPPPVEYLVSQDNSAFILEFVSPIDVTVFDNETVEIPIGFTFSYYGNPYSSCKVAANGFISFDPAPGGGCCGGQTIPDSLSPNNLIAIAWMDAFESNCCVEGNQFSVFQYETIGTSPSRRLVITFSMQEACGAYYYGQLKLFEGSSIIEMHTNYWADSNSPCNNVTQGIENAAGSGAKYWPGRNANTMWSVACCGDDVIRFTPSTALPPYDAGIAQINNEPFCAGNQEMSVFISNYGGQTLTDVEVAWEFDGVPQTPVSFNTPMPIGTDVYLVELGFQNLVFGEEYILKAWTDMPNGMEDSNHANDTMTAIIHVGLNGTYTIGGSSPDYATFQDAIADLDSIGICDTVTFNVREGVYNVHVRIPEVAGAHDALIVFQAEELDSTAVILQYNAIEADSNYVLRFDGADNITWQHMTLTALGSGYARVIELLGNATGNTIQHCAITGKNTTSTSSDYFCIFSGSNDHQLTLYQNTIKNGSSGFYHEFQISGVGGLEGGSPEGRVARGGGGGENEEPLEGLAFIGNHFIDFASRGIRTFNTLGIQIHQNTFHSSKANVMGIDIDDDNDSLAISANYIDLPSGAYGLHLTDILASGIKSATVYNNMIDVQGANCQSGILAINTLKFHLYHNTVRVSTSTPGRYALHHLSAMMDSVYNNIFVNLGGGTAMNMWPFTTNYFDFNNYYTTGSNLGFISINYADLEEWQIATNQEANSISVNPLFYSMTDLHARSSFLNAAGSMSTPIMADYDSEVRNEMQPDLGADEFVPAAPDAAITSVLSPVLTCDAEQEIKVVLTNLGADTLHVVTIQWTINGIAQSEVAYDIDLLPEGDTAHVVLASHTFSNTVDSFLVWVSLPNDTADMQPENDTLAFRFRLPFSGMVTIGGAAPDYPTIHAAVSDLNQFYTCGPVLFKIRDGVYTEQIEIDSIPTVSPINTITFESESLDSTAVTIQFQAIDGNHPAVIMLRGTDHVKFRHLGIMALASTWSDAIELRYSAKYITIEHCLFDMYAFGSSGIGVKSLCFNSPVNEFLTVRHNRFQNGRDGVYLYNCGNRQHDMVFENNEFVNQRFSGMDLSHITGLHIRNNSFTTNSSSTSYKAIDLNSLQGYMEISGNTVQNMVAGDGMFLDGINFGPFDGVTRVFNNMVKTTGAGGGIRLWNCEGTVVSNNTCNASGSGPAFEAAGGDSLTVVNNIFVSNTGRAIGSFSWTPHFTCDYNDLLTLSGAIGFWHDTLYSTFAEWQEGTHFDSNSMSIDPEFVSATDLHVLADTLDGAAVPIAGINSDIDGNPRNALAPDIGADEIGANNDDAGVFALLPEMPFARGDQEVRAVIRNYGGNTITACEIYWELNEVLQPVVLFNGSLPSLQLDTIVLGTVEFLLSTPYVIKAWTSEPNMNTDFFNTNDTLQTGIRYPAVSDTITIGGAAPELPTLAAAMTALTLGGVLDSVHFQLRSGTYHALLSVPQVPYMDCNTPVIFESETGNAADVILDNMSLTGHTVVLDGADGVHFRNLTIKTVQAAYHGVEFRGGAQCNLFEECRIEGVSGTSTSTNQAVIFSNSGNNHNNAFVNNTIKNGSYGMYWDGGANSTGAVVENNFFQNAYYTGLTLSRLVAPKATKNQVSSANMHSYSYGMHISECHLNAEITSNRVLLPGKRGVGILYSGSHGSAGQPALLANNFILLGQSTACYGIQYHYSSWTKVYYNTVRMTGGDASSIGIYRSYGTNVDIRNNIFDNRVGGRAMFFEGVEGPLSSNYNDLLTTGATLVYRAGSNYTNLAAWQATDFDTNSISEDPHYVTGDGYAITSAAVNGLGSPTPLVESDIESDPRDSLTPDMGCDEFSLATDDVGVLSINYPTEPFPSGENTVFIKFVNNGVDTLISMQVDWEVDGIAQPTYMWTGLLPTAAIYDSLDIGVYNFTPYQVHSIRVWVSLPNGVPDGLALNDTMEVNDLYPALLGTYTIGGSQPDFDSIGTAVEVLNLGGAAGPVIFNIRPGTYLETINIQDYPGSDCSRPVIFQSETLDSSDVILTNLGIDDNIVSLNGTDGVIFKYLTLQSVNPAYRNVVSFGNGAHCNQFLNNHLIGYQGTSSSLTDAVVHSTSSLDTANVFGHNLIQYGSLAFYLTGNGPNTNTLIQHNHLDDNYYHGIYASGESRIRILQNLITGGAYPYYGGIYLEYCGGANQIEKNDIRCLSAQYIIRLETCHAIIGARGHVTNNFLSAAGTSAGQGLLINNSKRYDVFHNNIHLNSAATSTALYFHTDSSLHLANNIVYNSGSGEAIYGHTQTSFNSDYNNIFYDGSFGRWNGTTMSNLAAWQTASGQDTNSMSLNPQYMSGSDLHVTNILLNGAGQPLASVTEDIDGDTRDPIPDIGADEFDPSIANDAGVFMSMGPMIPFSPGIHPITIALKNYGYNTLTAADVRWLVNGFEQPVYHWSGALAPAQCDTVVIGTYDFTEYTEHDFILWSEMPNGVPDSTHINDTLYVDDQFPALSGTYTVGGVLPDFNLFSQLERALNLGGILGNVTFDIRNGNYSAQFLIEDFPRISYAHQVIFQSEARDSSLVTIRKDFYLPSKNYTVKVSDAHHILFRDLTLASTQGRVLEIADQSSRITVETCRFLGVDIHYPSGTHQLIYSTTTTEDSIHVLQSRFEEGDYGIYLTASGGNPEKDVRIENNYFRNARYRSVYTQHHDGLYITGNTILVTQTDHEGIVVIGSASTKQISDNDIRLMAGGSYGMYLYDVSGTSAMPAAINNNYIFIQNWNDNAYGILHSYGNYNAFNYNSIRLSNTGPGSVAFSDNSSPQHIDIRNCNFANYSGGLTIYNFWLEGYTSNTMDYCNLYTTGPVLARYYNEYATLVDLQAGTSQNSQSVSAEPLFNTDGPDIFQAALDSAALPIAGIPFDIDGAIRNAATPDIGAKEFTLLAHDIGAKLLFTPETYCGLSNAEEVTIRIQNYGASTETGFDVAYSINGSGWHVENVGALAVSPGGIADYTFSVTEDMSVAGMYTFALRTQLTTDPNTLNDTIWNIGIEHIPALTDPVTNMIPTDGEDDLEQTISLSWAPAPDATVYDIYVWADGSSQPGTPQVSNITQINTVYNALNYGSTYHWRVVGKNICNQMVNGPVQQFTVRTLPDVVIDTVISPPTALSGEIIQIEWQVKNLGPGYTQSQVWSDAVYLSTDATLNVSFDTYLGAVQNLTALDSGIAYTHTGLFAIPHGYTGDYYVFVYADRWNNLLESQNNNNWDRSSQPITINLAPYPDIKVISVATPLTTFSGQTIPVTAVIKNIGTGSAPSTIWHDRIYFGSDPLNFGTGQHVGTITHTGPLEVDSVYTINTNVSIPNGIFGEYYVYVVSDYNNEVFENAAESNNVGISDTIEVILTPPGDLFAFDFVFPDTLHNNQPASFQYAVTNQGGSTIVNSSWYDQIYISQAPIYNPNFLTPTGTVNNYGPFVTQDTLYKSLPFTLPIWTSGQYYFYVYLDRGNYVFEHTFEYNNILRSTGTFTVVNPDLRPAEISHPDTATAGHVVTVAWHVLNDGPGHVYSRAWQTKIYISDDPVFNPAEAIVLKTLYPYTPLTESGDTLMMSTAVMLPNGISGNWYFHIVEDAQGVVFEDGNETDNTASSTAIWINLPPYPDLISRQIEVPDTLTAGTFFTFQYEKANTGEANASMPSIDSFYLSFSPVWNPISNKVLGRQAGIPALASMDSMSYSPTVSISSQQTSNVYYIYIKSDATSAVYEYLGESNNIERSEPFFVNPAPAVDLVLDTVSSLLTASSGLPFAVSYTIRNASASAASLTGWQDALYLSVDSIFDADLDLRFFETPSGAGGLAENQSYNRTVNTNIPHGLSGDYYLIARADDSRVNIENDTLNNLNTIRILGDATPIHIDLSPSPDLRPVLFSAPTLAYSGQPFDIMWSVRNDGDAAAQTWFDKIYLSTDNVISQGDILLSTSPRSGVNLAPGETLTDTVSVFVNSQVEGNYLLIIKTDAEQSVYEHLGENNNQISRSIAFTASPPSDLMVTSILLPDSSIAGGTITVSWNTINAGSNPTNGLMREIVYLSADESLDVDDQLFGLTDQALYLPPGSSLSRSMAGPVSGVTNGDYFAIVQTDARDNIVESNDTNNISASFNQMNVAIEELFLDSLTLDSLYNGQEHYFRLEIPLAYQHRNLRITLDGDSLGMFTEMYLKYGNVPTLSDYEQRHLFPYAEDQELLYEDLLAGDYYIMVKGHTGHAAGQRVTLLARIIDFELLSIKPERGSNRGQTTIELLGTQMDTLRRVYLVRDSSYIALPNPGTNAYPLLFVPGSHQDWDPADTTSALASVNSDNIYEGYIYFPDDTNYILLTTLPNWSNVYGDNGGNGSLEINGDTIVVPYSGFFRVRVNLNTFSYTLLETYWSISGSALGGTLSESMGYDIEDRFWHIRTDLLAGEFVFRANQDGSFTYGDTGMNGLLESNGSAIQIPKDGNYTIHFYLDHGDHTYSIEHTSDDLILADTITEINSQRAYATFQLEGVPTGMYTVRASRYDGKIAELVDAFEVIDGGEEPGLQVIMDYPGVVGRRNAPMKITIFFHNAGDADLVNKSFHFEAPWGNEVALTYEALLAGNSDTSIDIQVQGPFGPAGILPPKSGNVIEIFAWSHPHPTFTLTPTNE